MRAYNDMQSTMCIMHPKHHGVFNVSLTIKKDILGILKNNYSSVNNSLADTISFPLYLRPRGSSFLQIFEDSIQPTFDLKEIKEIYLP